VVADNDEVWRTQGPPLVERSTTIFMTVPLAALFFHVSPIFWPLPPPFTEALRLLGASGGGGPFGDVTLATFDGAEELELFVALTR
jgi:hypothetical protein